MDLAVLRAGFLVLLVIGIILLWRAVPSGPSGVSHSHIVAGSREKN